MRDENLKQEAPEQIPPPPSLNPSVSFSLQADPEDCPARLDAYLAEHLAEFSRSKLQRLIKSGDVLVNGAPARQSLSLKGDEVLDIQSPPPAAPTLEAENIPLDVLFEDDEVIIINKPAGLVVHPGAGVHSGTLVNALLYHFKNLSTLGGGSRPGIVHRLDRLTSGCIAVAKTDFAHHALAAQLQDHSLGREYLAWVIGQMPAASGRVDAPIGRSFSHRTRMAVVKQDGRPAATNWEVVKNASGLTRVICRLETGRTHQIRVHMAHLGHPVVGDPEYGLTPRDARMRIPAGNPALIAAISHANRQLLHAWRIHFTHPRTGERLVFEAPLPDDFQAFDAAAQ